MPYFFVFYLKSTSKAQYTNPNYWIDVEHLQKQSSTIVIHSSGTHYLHRIGDYLNNFGMSSALIIEATTDEDRMLLSLQLDSLLIDHQETASNSPELQYIYGDPKFDELFNICAPIMSLKNFERIRREEVQVMIALQKIADRTRDTIVDFTNLLSDSYMNEVDGFLQKTSGEIDRIQEHHIQLITAAKSARRKLYKELTKYSLPL